MRSLLDAGLSSTRVHAALRWVRESGDDLASLRIVTDGRSVWACHDDGQILDALHAGQLALFVAVDRLAADVDADVRAFDAERAAFVERLTEAGPSSDVASSRSRTDAGLPAPARVERATLRRIAARIVSTCSHANVASVGDRAPRGANIAALWRRASSISAGPASPAPCAGA